MSIGFTGTQVGLTPEQQIKLKEVLLREGGWFSEVHHGDCIGADASCHDLAVECGFEIIIHPPTIDKKRAFCKGYKHMCAKYPYLERNRHIVDATDVLVACPKGKEEEVRSGTWSTVRYAQKTGKSVVIIYPDGEVIRNDP